MSARNPDADVLTWGCPVAKRLVRGRLADGTKLPKAKQSQDAEVIVSCPVCGQEHRVVAMTRPRRRGDHFDADPVVLRRLATKRRPR
jgi:hypothetical protein